MKKYFTQIINITAIFSFIGLVQNASFAKAIQEISVEQFFIEIEADPNLKASVLSSLEVLIQNKVANPHIARALVAKISKIGQDSLNGSASAQRFPKVRLDDVDQVRALLKLQFNEGATAAPVATSVAASEESLDGVEKVYIESWLSPTDCSAANQSELSPVVVDESGTVLVATGHVGNASLSACDKLQAKRLSALMSALSREPLLLKAELQGATVASVEDLLKKLYQSGHNIELLSERTFADFIALVDMRGTEPVYIRWPVWIESNIQLNGEALMVPAGHSQYTWRVTGPLVKQSEIGFFLGVSGANFFAKTTTRPTWTGSLVKKRYSADSQKPFAAARFASAYLRLNQKENALYQPALSRDGYGFFGICNDSTAVLENLLMKQVTVWPLLRDQQANSLIQVRLLGQLTDDEREVAKSLFALPVDTTRNYNSLENDQGSRILDMLPYSLQAKKYWSWDPLLHRQLLDLKSTID